MQREARVIGGSFNRGLSSAGIGAGIGALFLTKESVQAASDLAESQSKVNVVFKDGAPLVEEWSESAATGLGISKQAALEAAGTFGNFLISMGLVPKTAQDMSTSLVGLASDLASFNNTSPEEALIAIRSGLAGEIEPLRRYGVALSAARLENEAAAQGINKTSAEMSAAEKATLAYQIIIQDTALAQGDFERTSDGLANQQRILAARLKDAEAQLGAKLIPLLLTAANAAVTLGKGLGTVNKATDGWLGTLAGAAVVGGSVALLVSKIGSGVGRLVTVFTASATAAEVSAAAQGTLATSSTAAAVAMDTQTASAGVLTTKLKLLPSVLAAVAVGFIAGKKAGDEINDLLVGATPNVDRFTAGLIELGKTGSTSIENLDFGRIAGDLDSAIGSDTRNPVKGLRAFTPGAHQAKADIDALNDSLVAMLGTLGPDKALLAFGRFQEALVKEGATLGQITSFFEPFFTALDLAQAKEIETSNTTNQLTADFQGLSDSISKQTAKLGIADSLDSAQDAVDELNELKLDAAGQGQRSTDAAKAEKRAQDSLSDAYDSQNKAAGSLLEAKAKLADFDSQTDARIRELERQQIASRVVTTPEEARQKEIDLLKFDDDAIERRADLQRGIASAADGVTAAEERVGDAIVAVSDAAKARRQVQVDAADQIADAERRVEQQILAATEQILAAKDAQLIGNDALAVYIGLLDVMNDRLAPNSPLSKRLSTFLEQLTLGELLKGITSLPPVGTQTSILTFTPRPTETGAHAPTAGGPVKVADTINFHGSDQPTIGELDTLNRKQAIRLANSRLGS